MDIAGLFLFLFYFGLYLIPAFPVQIFFIVQSNRPRPILSACINFVIWSVLLVLWIIYGVPASGSTVAITVIGLVMLGIAMLVMLPLVMIILDFFSPLIYRYIIHWKSKQTHAKTISALCVLFIYIVFGFVSYLHIGKQ